MTPRLSVAEELLADQDDLHLLAVDAALPGARCIPAERARTPSTVIVPLDHHGRFLRRSHGRHKYRRWRAFLKGVFDGRAASQRILVSGSARLDCYRHGGESLQGR